VHWWQHVLTAVAAYLLGSLPTGYLVGRMQGIDIRRVGSGNIGATNVFRVLGRWAGAGVLAADGLKGLLACWLVAGYVGTLGAPLADAARPAEALAVVAGISAVLGHNYTCWLRFRGGKGIATSAGVLLALVPWALLVSLVIWVGVFGCSRYVSLASIAAAFVLPFAVWLTGGTPTMIALTAGLATLAIGKHHANIRRLLQGTEHRIGRPKDQASP
jgi:glycerol-3-phosphate acyltransferase PlsY